MESAKMIWTLIEGTNDLVQSVRSDGTFEYVNKSWLRTLGYTSEEFPDLHLSDVIHPAHLKQYQEYVARVMKGESLDSIEVTFVTKEGRIVHTEGNLYPRYEGSRMDGTQGFYRNVTERKQAEEIAREERIRTGFFVDIMTHDLTNINQEVLSTFELLLQTSALSPEMDELVREGLAETERAAALIANVKKLSQLHGEKTEIVEVDPADVLREASKDVQARFRDKRLLLRTNLSSGEYSVLANRYLRDVFYSLLDNAMKFDERKKVEVDVEAASISHTPFLKIQIKDRGCGLTDEQKDEIFLRIVDRRQSILGLGLGLTLVKEILEGFGGQINVEDRVEGDHTKGANFILLLRSSPTRQQKGGAV